jgi:hypothetical protein
LATSQFLLWHKCFNHDSGLEKCPACSAIDSQRSTFARSRFAKSDESSNYRFSISRDSRCVAKTSLELNAVIYGPKSILSEISRAFDHLLELFSDAADRSLEVATISKLAAQGLAHATISWDKQSRF